MKPRHRFTTNSPSKANAPPLPRKPSKERVERSEEKISTAGEIRLKDFKALLFERYPSLVSLDPYLRWAVNQSFVDEDELILKSGDEVALIPPISGG